MKTNNKKLLEHIEESYDDVFRRLKELQIVNDYELKFYKGCNCDKDKEKIESLEYKSHLIKRLISELEEDYGYYWLDAETDGEEEC